MRGRDRAPKPSPAPTDSRGREMPSTSSPGTAGPSTGFTLASYQDDSADQSGGAEAEQAWIDDFNQKLGLVSGMLGTVLYATPAGPVLLAISGVTGLYEIKRGIETGDPARVGWGALGSIPKLGSISRSGRLGAGLGAATGATRAETRIVSGATVTPQGKPPMTGNVDVGPTLNRIRSGGARSHIRTTAPYS